MMAEKEAPQADAGNTSPTSSKPDGLGATIAAEHTPEKAPKREGSHTQETVDPAERLPDEPEEQNDLA